MEAARGAAAATAAGAAGEREREAATAATAATAVTAGSAAAMAEEVPGASTRLATTGLAMPTKHLRRTRDPSPEVSPEYPREWSCRRG